MRKTMARAILFVTAVFLLLSCVMLALKGMVVSAKWALALSSGEWLTYLTLVGALAVVSLCAYGAMQIVNWALENV